MKSTLVVSIFALLILAACSPAPAAQRAPTAQPAGAQTPAPAPVTAVPPARPDPSVAAPAMPLAPTQSTAAAPTVAAPASAAAQPTAGRPAGGPPSAAGGTAAGPAQPTTVISVPPNLPADQLPYWLSWRSGPHADTYGLDKGPNTFCARCHAPANYDAQSKVDAPPNCVSCKFPTDAQVRLAEHNKFITRGDWQSIGCDVCHQAAPTGGVLKAIAWRDPATRLYQPVASAADLCSKCHTDTETLRHRRDLGQSAHKGFTCVGCHDAHSMAASCTSAQCHPAVAVRNAGTFGHDPKHAKVDCAACHDAAKLQIGRVKDTGVWTTWRTTELLGRKTTAQYQSHALQRQVDCARCHFPGNSFGLPENVKTQP